MKYLCCSISVNLDSTDYTLFFLTLDLICSKAQNIPEALWNIQSLFWIFKRVGNVSYLAEIFIGSLYLQMSRNISKASCIKYSSLFCKYSQWLRMFLRNIFNITGVWCIFWYHICIWVPIIKILDILYLLNYLYLLHFILFLRYTRVSLCKCKGTNQPESGIHAALHLMMWWRG